MKYCVYITELHYGSVHVEAGSDDEAIQKAEKLYAQQQVLWYDGELIDVSSKEEII